MSSTSKVTSPDCPDILMIVRGAFLICDVLVSFLIEGHAIAPDKWQRDFCGDRCWMRIDET